jgi:glycosyltransferase involved in cell wall biosynthesis
MDQQLKVTLIISVYKDTESLKLILDSLLNQTVKDFEIIVSEDCQSEKMKLLLAKYQKFGVIHISQEDIGWRKNLALNNAVRKSSGDYLIFIDGDIIPYSDFVEKHIESITEKRILCGKRVELGSFFSKLIRKGYLKASILDSFFYLFLPFVILDKARHIEEGIRLKKGSKLEQKLNKKRPMIIGCNFSCFKKDFIFINGFDEDYISPSVGEDIDLTWRFQHFEIDSKSVRYLANTFHLYHKRIWNSQNVEKNNKIMKEKWDNEEYICKNGYNKLEYQDYKEIIKKENK